MDDGVGLLLPASHEEQRAASAAIESHQSVGKVWDIRSDSVLRTRLGALQRCIADTAKRNVDWEMLEHVTKDLWQPEEPPSCDDFQKFFHEYFEIEWKKEKLKVFVGRRNVPMSPAIKEMKNAIMPMFLPLSSRSRKPAALMVVGGDSTARSPATAPAEASADVPTDVGGVPLAGGSSAGGGGSGSMIEADSAEGSSPIVLQKRRKVGRRPLDVSRTPSSEERRRLSVGVSPGLRPAENGKGKQKQKEAPLSAGTVLSASFRRAENITPTARPLKMRNLLSEAAQSFAEPGPRFSSQQGDLAQAIAAMSVQGVAAVSASVADIVLAHEGFLQYAAPGQMVSFDCDPVSLLLVRCCNEEQPADAREIEELARAAVWMAPTESRPVDQEGTSRGEIYFDGAVFVDHPCGVLLRGIWSPDRKILSVTCCFPALHHVVLRVSSSDSNSARTHVVGDTSRPSLWLTVTLIRMPIDTSLVIVPVVCSA